MESQLLRLSAHIPKVMSRGTIFFTEDLEGFFPDTRTLRLVLSDMARDGSVIVRLARGVYCYPREDSRMLRLLPSPEEIALAYAARWRVPIAPCGAYAAYLSGLSPFPQGRYTYYSGGQRQVVHLSDGRTIDFVSRKSLKLFSMQSPEFRNLCEGFRWLGKDGVKEFELGVASGVLRNLDPSLVFHDIKLAPGWIRETFLSLMSGAAGSGIPD